MSNTGILKYPAEITGFYSDEVERQTLHALKDAAQAAGFGFRLSNNLAETAEIGIYSMHCCSGCARRSRLSAVVLHDLAQGHNLWPDIWSHERWAAFDIGFLPGDDWADRWRAAKKNPEAHPRLGMYIGGWAKADRAAAGLEEFRAQAGALRESLQLQHDVSVLYAPSWENDCKQHEFVLALKDMPVNLLIKQCPWPDTHPEQQAAIAYMADMHRNLPNVHIIDSNVSIMLCLALSDAMVSDESSVLAEALIFGVPGIAVTDWTIPDETPPRLASFPLDFAFSAAKAELRDKVSFLLKYRHALRNDLLERRHRYFGFLGHGAERTIQVIADCWNGKRPEGRLK